MKKFLCFFFSIFVFSSSSYAMYSGNPYCCDSKYFSDDEKYVFDRSISSMATGAVGGSVEGFVSGGPASAVTGATSGGLGEYVSGGAEALYEIHMKQK